MKRAALILLFASLLAAPALGAFGIFQTFAPASASFPSIAGLNFHVRAQDLALSPGATVTTWNDISGAGNNLTSGTPLYFPTSALDSVPYVSFGGNITSADSIVQTSYSINKQAWSVLYVIDIEDIEAPHYIMDLNSLTLTFLVNTSTLQWFNGPSTTFRPSSGRRIAILTTFGGSAVKVYVDNSTNVQSFSALSAGTITGGFVISSSASLTAKVYEVAAWNAELSGSDAASLLDTWAPSAYGTGGSASPSGHVVFDGDSITQGIGSTQNQNWPYLFNPSNGWVGHDFAISGETWANLIARQSDTNFFANGTNWLLVFAGTNDLSAGRTAAQIEADFQTYLNAAVVAGFDKSKIVVFTISAHVAANSDRVAFNSWLRSNYTTYAGFLVDLAHDPQLGSSDATGDPTVPANWFDGAHYDNAGYVLFAALVRSTIGTVPF